MARITVVRSLVGERLELPGGVIVRPWHFAELKEVTDEQKSAIGDLSRSRQVQVCDVVDGRPLDHAPGWAR